MDFGIVAGVLMLIGWAIWALVLEGPGWIHLFLTLGVTLVIYRIVVRGSRPRLTGKDAE